MKNVGLDFFTDRFWNEKRVESVDSIVDLLTGEGLSSLANHVQSYLLARLIGRKTTHHL